MDENMTDERNMDLERLKAQWKDVSLRIDVLERENDRLEKEIVNNRIISYKQKLQRQALALSIVSFVQVTWCLPLTHSLDLPIWFGWALVAFFVMGGLMNNSLRLYLSGINLAVISAEKLAEAMCTFVDMRKRYRIIMGCMGVPLLLIYLYELSEFGDEYLLWGAVAGAVIGLAFGLLINSSARRYIRAIKDSL